MGQRAASRYYRQFRLAVDYFDKGKGLDTCYSATYMSQTRDQQRFTIVFYFFKRYVRTLMYSILAHVYPRAMKCSLC